MEKCQVSGGKAVIVPLAKGKKIRLSVTTIGVLVY